MSLLIVQPWFTAIGHPARSVVNTAKALGARADVGYLVSDPGVGELSCMAKELRQYGSTTLFRSFGSTLRTGTVLSLPAILRIARTHRDLDQVFFLDADLVSLAMTWPIASLASRRVKFLGVLYLKGPERIAGNTLARKVVSGFLSSVGRRLFLRTNELTQAWREAFPEVPAGRIDTLPSLEILDEPPATDPGVGKTGLHFGVIGQVRPGKSLEWLVPMFADNAAIGSLHVAGAFTNTAHRDRLSFLASYANFDNRFLSEADMLLAASRQDYLVALYDDWDARMEAATLYLAAQVGKPVIVYDEGWPGRMVREFGCGIAVARTPRPGRVFFENLPRPGQDRYRELLDGVRRFRGAHDGRVLSKDFLAKMSGAS
jgi:hypothetical protein